MTDENNRRHQFNPAIIADMIQDEHRVIHDLESGQLYVYHDGFYDSIHSENILRRYIANRLGNYNESHVKTILSYLRDTRQGDIPKFHKKTHMCLENGSFNLETFELEEHTPNNVIITRIPVKYDANADYKDWINLLYQWVPHEEQVMTLQEFTGYTFIYGQKAKKLLYTYGKRHSAKSTFYDILFDFFGQNDNCSTLSLIQLCTKYDDANLYGKIANIRSDIEYDLIPDSVNQIKSLTAGDPITVEKKYKDPFTFRNTAKIYLSGNGVPSLPNKGVDDAFYSRWIPIEFPNLFEKDKKDTTIKDKFTTPEQKSAIFNWALEGLKRLLDNNFVFTYSPSISEIENWFSQGWILNYVERFLTERCLPSISEFVGKSLLYVEYFEWTDEKGFPRLDENAFGRKVKNNRVYPLIDFYPTVDGKQVHTWKGIRLQNK
ncbi:MAG: hypothetical protein KAJ44_00475 [Thermoplasmatales archaeon]|nr:hypothetical protein [Thermoplasmatales archaeon]